MLLISQKSLLPLLILMVGNYGEVTVSKPVTLRIKLWCVICPAPFVPKTWMILQMMWRFLSTYSFHPDDKTDGH